MIGVGGVVFLVAWVVFVAVLAWDESRSERPSKEMEQFYRRQRAKGRDV